MRAIGSQVNKEIAKTERYSATRVASLGCLIVGMTMDKEDEFSENGRESSAEEKEQQSGNVLKFLDSTDNYLILMDSLSSTLRQGWLELASARHSMGASRISSALFDLKYHSAATTLQVNCHDADSTEKKQHFTLCKWASSDNQKFCSDKANYEEDELVQRKSNSALIQDRGTCQHFDCKNTRESNGSESIGSPLSGDNHVQKERSKSLSIFGTLVSPKLRAAQLSFETALENLTEIANVRSSMLCAYDQVQKEMKSNTE